MSLLGTLGLRDAAVLAVVIMKTSEVQAISGDLVYKGDNLFYVILVDAGGSCRLTSRKIPTRCRALPICSWAFSPMGNLHAGNCAAMACGRWAFAPTDG